MNFEVNLPFASFFSRAASVPGAPTSSSVPAPVLTSPSGMPQAANALQYADRFILSGIHQGAKIIHKVAGILPKDLGKSLQVGSYLAAGTGLLVAGISNLDFTLGNFLAIGLPIGLLGVHLFTQIKYNAFEGWVQDRVILKGSRAVEFGLMAGSSVIAATLLGVPASYAGLLAFWLTGDYVGQYLLDSQHLMDGPPPAKPQAEPTSAVVPPADAVPSEPVAAVPSQPAAPAVPSELVGATIVPSGPAPSK